MSEYKGHIPIVSEPQSDGGWDKAVVGGEKDDKKERRPKFTVEPLGPELSEMLTGNLRCVVVPKGAKYTMDNLVMFAIANGAYDRGDDESAGQEPFIIVRIGDEKQKEIGLGKVRNDRR